MRQLTMWGAVIAVVADDCTWPAGINQISLDSSGTHHRQADTPTFARPGVGVLPMGERIENGPAACTVTGQGPVACRLADGGYGILR